MSIKRDSFPQADSALPETNRTTDWDGCYRASDASDVSRHISMFQKNKLTRVDYPLMRGENPTLRRADTIESSVPTSYRNSELVDSVFSPTRA